MSDKNEIVEMKNNELLDIFLKEEDKKGTDLLAMSDFFNVFIEKIAEEIETETAWKAFHNIEGIIGEIATAIKSGFDISKMGMLVADYSHFSQDIIDGIKSGAYHIGQSKEVAGNLRPAILDDNEQLVKFFTLKKANNPSNVLSDISTLCIQASLQRISSQIEDIGRAVKIMNESMRIEKLNNKFICARGKIMLASTANGEECEKFLKEADTYLMEGLVNLYTDINEQVKQLAKQNGPFARIKTIDSLLSYINEDMQMIPRYVGLRVYIFNYRGKSTDAKRTLEEYKYNLKKFSEEKIKNSKFTALELIHKNYPYDKENVDFWLNEPVKMLDAIDTYEKMIEQKDKDIFYIDAEDVNDEF